MPVIHLSHPAQFLRSLSLLASLTVLVTVGCGDPADKASDRRTTSDTGSSDDVASAGDTGPSSTDDTGDSTDEPVRSLDGDPDGMANDFIPDIPFLAPESDDFSDDDGASISRRTLLLIFDDETTVAEANDLLKDFDAEIIGGISAASLLYLRVPDQTLTEAKSMSSGIDPALAIAALDCDGLTSKRLPPNNMDDPHWDWWWSPELIETGEWGLKAVRAPQLLLDRDCDDIIDYMLLSTSRGKGADVFAPWEQLESISADEEHGPFVTVTAATEALLEERMYEEANARLVSDSMLKSWLGTANLVVPGWGQECVAWEGEACSLYEGKLWGALISG
jgi:hypothetical protein